LRVESATRPLSQNYEISEILDSNWDTPVSCRLTRHPWHLLLRLTFPPPQDAFCAKSRSSPLRQCWSLEMPLQSRKSTSVFDYSAFDPIRGNDLPDDADVRGQHNTCRSPSNTGFCARDCLYYAIYASELAKVCSQWLVFKDNLTGAPFLITSPMYVPMGPNSTSWKSVGWNVTRLLWSAAEIQA